MYSVIIALRRTFSKLEVSLSQLKREKQRLNICIWNIAEYFELDSLKTILFKKNPADYQDNDCTFKSSREQSNCRVKFPEEYVCFSCHVPEFQETSIIAIWRYSSGKDERETSFISFDSLLLLILWNSR